MQGYQPLPISTGNVGVDRCGNVVAYAAPGVVHARVCWPACGWPIPPQGWPWGGYGRPGCGCGGFSDCLAAVMTSRVWLQPKPAPSAAGASHAA